MCGMQWMIKCYLLHTRSIKVLGIKLHLDSKKRIHRVVLIDYIWYFIFIFKLLSKEEAVISSEYGEGSEQFDISPSENSREESTVEDCKTQS